MGEYLSLSACTNTSDIESLLVQLDPYIIALTKRLSSTNLVDSDREEIAQHVRLKLAEALPGKEVSNLRVYLKQTVYHEFISFLRRKKLSLPIVANEDGEPCCGRVLISVSQGMGDPQVEYDQKLSFTELMDRVVEALLALPPVQREAMVCFIRERLDDPSQFLEAFERHNLDVTFVRWPEDHRARQRLQASCRPARFRMAQHMQINLGSYRGQHIDTCCLVRLDKKGGAVKENKYCF